MEWKMNKIKKAPYMGHLYVGDTMVDIHGYGRGEICEVYISDTDISVWEMIHALNWDKFEKDADEAAYLYAIS
jgi:hypothetical protein